MVPTTDGTATEMVSCNFQKNFTATPFPEKPTEDIECQNFMLKIGVFGVNPTI